jgi:hypothetical protein
MICKKMMQGEWVTCADHAYNKSRFFNTSKTKSKMKSLNVTSCLQAQELLNVDIGRLGLPASYISHWLPQGREEVG